VNAPDVLSRFRLDGRTAIITGVGPGMGSHVARTFAAAGANVVLCARDGPKVEALAAALQADGHAAVPVAADVGTPDGVDDLVARATQAFGTIHILYHNATARALVPGGDPLALTDDEWQACFDVNVMAVVRLARTLLPGMRAEGGSIVTVLTTAAFVPTPDISAWAYASTKAALLTLTRNIATECAPHVRANAICPGPIVAAIDSDDPRWPLWRAQIGSIPLGRVGLAAEVEAAALFLASEASSYVTGQVIFVDGGRVIAGGLVSGAPPDGEAGVGRVA
jgi:gluconate 5-dehydrogenase/7-alpha-hydroxysteroid dehydrogenase